MDNDFGVDWEDPWSFVRLAICGISGHASSARPASALVQEGSTD